MSSIKRRLRHSSSTILFYVTNQWLSPPSIAATAINFPIVLVFFFSSPFSTVHTHNQNTAIHGADHPFAPSPAICLGMPYCLATGFPSDLV